MWLGDMMRILLTGGTGYIGTSLINLMLKDNVEIYNITRDKIVKYHQQGIIELSNYNFLNLSRKIDELNFDVAVNLAASYYFEEGEGVDVISGNLNLPFLILESFKNKNKKFINIGTYWEYSLSRKNVKGVNPYGIIKKTTEGLIEYYRAYNVTCVDIKLYGTYGSNDSRGKIIDILIDATNEQKEIKVSKGEQSLNLVHVDDVTQVIRNAIFTSDYDNLKIGIASDKEYTVNQLIKLISKHKKINIARERNEYRNDEVITLTYLDDNMIYVKDRVAEYISDRVGCYGK